MEILEAASDSCLVAPWHSRGILLDSTSPLSHTPAESQKILGWHGAGLRGMKERQILCTSLHNKYVLIFIMHLNKKAEVHGVLCVAEIASLWLTEVSKNFPVKHCR